MEEDTDGSELIRRRIFADDPRPLYLLAGGGTNTIARALKRIEEDYAGTCDWGHIYRQVCDSCVIFMIVTQDNTYRDYIAGAWPDLRMLHCTSIHGIAFMFDEESLPTDALGMFKGTWLKPHLLDKGPLCARYHTWLEGHVCSKRFLACHPCSSWMARFVHGFSLRRAPRAAINHPLCGWMTKMLCNDAPSPLAW
ncbi:MAG: DUF1593 domain-containing protein [Atopobiaceae bacterium]|nr:DUF1593 domain-containing protein [Atopobiaceae bacterium]